MLSIRHVYLALSISRLLPFPTYFVLFPRPKRMSVCKYERGNAGSFAQLFRKVNRASLTRISH